MDENEQNSFGFDSSNLSEHEQALIDAVNQGKNLSQAKGSSNGGSFPASVQKSKKSNFFGNLVSSFSKNAAAFAKDDSGGNQGTSSSVAMLDRTADTGGSGSALATRPNSVVSRIASRSKAASENISDGVAGLGGLNSASSTTMTPYQRQELLIMNRIKDDVSTIADLIKDLDGKPSTKGTTDLLKGHKEKSKPDSLLDKILAALGGLLLGGGGIGGQVAGAVKTAFGTIQGLIAGLLKGGVNVGRELLTGGAKALGRGALNVAKWAGGQAARGARALVRALPGAARATVQGLGRAAGAGARAIGRGANAVYNFVKDLMPAPKRGSMLRNLKALALRGLRKARPAIRAVRAGAMGVGRVVGRAAIAAGKGAAAVAKFTGKAARVGAKFAVGTAKLAGRATAMGARMMGAIVGTGKTLASVAAKASGLGAVGKLFGRAVGVGQVISTGVDIYNDYKSMGKNPDRAHQVGGAINMGLDVVGGIAGMAAAKGFVPGMIIAGAAHMAHTVVKGAMNGPKNRRLEAGIAAWGNEEDDIGERFKNLNFNHQNSSKAFWDPARYGFETNDEKRNDLISELSGKTDAKSLARIKSLKSLQLVNNKTYKDYDFSAGNMWKNFSGAFTGSNDNNFNNVFHNLGNMAGSELSKVHMPAVNFPHIPKLPDYKQLVQGAEKTIGNAVTTITAPFTQTFSTVFNNATIFSKEEVKKVVEDILRDKNKADDMVKRAMERYGTLGNNPTPATSLKK